jgi:hypothetical protein
VIELVRSRYADFGASLAAEVLFEKDGVKVSRETLRRWMVEDGLWLSRKQRRSFVVWEIKASSVKRPPIKSACSTKAWRILLWHFQGNTRIYASSANRMAPCRFAMGLES